MVTALPHLARPLECRACRRVHRRPLRASGEAYRGINVVMLWASRQQRMGDEGYAREELVALS